MKIIIYLILISFSMYIFSPVNLFANPNKTNSNNTQNNKEMTKANDRERISSSDTPILSGKKSGNKAVYFLLGGAGAGVAVYYITKPPQPKTGTISIAFPWPE